MANYSNKYYPVAGIETIKLIGVGGTGAYLAEHLARMISGYNLTCTLVLYDGDRVGKENIFRQNFSSSEIGLNKAEALAFRLSRQFGIVVSAVDQYYKLSYESCSCLIVSCTDTINSRKSIAKSLASLWLDVGNELEHGQAIIGTTYNVEKLRKEFWNWHRYDTIAALPNVAALNPVIMKGRSKAKRAGCANMPFAEQGFGVNAMAALAAAKICKEVLVDGTIKTHGVYFNVAEGRMVSRLIDKSLYHVWKNIKGGK